MNNDDNTLVKMIKLFNPSNYYSITSEDAEHLVTTMFLINMRTVHCVKRLRIIPTDETP